MFKYADIIVAITNKKVDRIFTYKISEKHKDLIHIGSRVLVPFGNSNKKTEGYVISFKENIDFDLSKLKEIDSLPDDKPIFTESLVELAIWMKEKYYTSLASVLKCIMPTGINIVSDYLVSVIKESNESKKAKEVIDYILKNGNKVSFEELKEEFSNVSNTILALEKKEVIQKIQLSKTKDYIIRIKHVSINLSNEENELKIDELIEEDKVYGKILSLLKENVILPLNEIKNILNISDSPILTLEKRNLIVIEKIEVRRNTLTNDGEIYKNNIDLTNEQKEVINHLLASLNLHKKKPVLINGVTGSGKTEVYLKIIEEVLNQGKEAIVLVPEISLTPQTVSRFTSRFNDKVSVTHSRLTLGERYDQFKKARDKEISIMIGPRSAIFTPFNNLGVIIIDEEHENTYISETTPKYNAKEVAIKLAEITNSLVIMGSATPSVNSFYNTQEGIYELLEMPKRVNEMLPEIKIVDMRNEFLEGNRSIFSNELRESLEENIKNGNQSILFLNRRGHSTFVSCRACGHVLECSDCNVNFTYHLYTKKMICHYCGKEALVPENCPMCGSQFIKFFGVGTQKIEEETKKLFPNENILRMDLDTVSKKNSHEKILTSFRKLESKILIGTQMIAKGLDFPNVTLVGIIAADVALNNGDYRGGETTFQLLSQVSGRAGRDKIKGKVFIQTYNPDHYSIVFTKEHNYKKFYEYEIALRRQMLYPPFSNLFTIMFTSDNEKDIIMKLFKLTEIMNHYNKIDQFDILGPTPCVISKIKNKFRWKIIVKSLNEEKLKNFVFFCLKTLEKNQQLTNIIINATLNPVNIL